MTDSSSQFAATDHPESGNFPFSGAPQFTKTSETVVNPEGKPVVSEQGSSHLTVKPDAELQRALFPDLSVLEAGDVPPSPSGLKLAHFEIVDRIGSGGMGSVFLALDLHLQRYVALKILAPAQAREASAIQRFLNEARSAARLDYDGIARVHYYGEDRGYHFIAFEYVTGTNVRDLIQQSGPLNPADAINFTLQVAHALKQTSAAGVVHRDIKPSNIIVNPSGRAKLVDLGLARQESTGSMEDLTAAGTTLGTFDYISPEQAQDPRNVDVRSDIYSLGCTLYHMLTAEPPYPQGTLAQKLLDHQQSYVPNPADRNRRVPVQLAAVTQKMMASDPKKRYQSPESLIRDLLAVANDQGLRGVTPEGLVWSGGLSKPKHQFWIKYGSWLIAVAALLSIVYAMEWIDPQNSKPENQVTESRSASESDRLPSPKTTRESAESTSPSETQESEQSRRESVLAAPTDGQEGSVAGDLNENRSVDPATEVAEDDDTPDFREPFSGSVDGTDYPAWLPRPVVENSTIIPYKSGLDPIREDAGSQVSKASPLSPLRPGREESPETTSPPEEPASPIVLVSGSGSTENYDTLEAACANARSGSVIELWYDGSLPNRTEKPISINRHLTIKAATNYRPVVEFTTTRETPDESDTRMITIRKGSLNLVGIDLRLNVKHPVSYTARDTWTMFSLQGPDQLSLQNVSVTVENPEGHPAVMFEMVRGPGADSDEMMNNEINPGRTTVNVDPFALTINNSYLRGECQACVIKTVRPGTIRLERSLVAAQNGLLINQGANNAPGELNQLEVNLEHVTVVTSMSPFRFDSGEARYLLHTALTCEDSLFVLEPMFVAPFISMSGDTNPFDFRDSITWNGLKNFYHGFSVFRTISDSRGNSELPDLAFEAWDQFWSQRDDSSESDTNSGTVKWTNALKNFDFSELTPDQLQIEMDAEQQLDLLATDGSTVGADLNALPRPPERRIEPDTE